MYNDENLLNDQGPLTDRTYNFFVDKTIQRNYNFLVYFDESGSGEFEDLLAFHAIGVEIPDYSFKKEYINFGNFSKSFPILEHNGFEFNIKMEEDEMGTVKELIHKLIRKQIGSDGYYKSYKSTTIDQIVASVYTQDAWNCYKVYFKNCFFLKSSTAQYSFSSSDKIEYDITFNCDHYEIIPHIGAKNVYESDTKYQKNDSRVYNHRREERNSKFSK